MVPDVAQIFLKGEGIFTNVGSAKHKCKLRALYEGGAVGFLCEKAGGKTITTDKKSLLDF
jgi:fructose-1,6-bisphosphatase